jgi:hypothetical protein
MVDGPVICFLRDPVTRFLSAARRLKMSPAALLEARERGDNKLTPAPELLLRDQAWWLDRSGVETYQMEQLDLVWPRIVEEWNLPFNPLPEHSDPNRNESPGGLPDANTELQRSIENSYDEDMELWVTSYAY